MKKDLHLTANFDQPELLENMVEKLAEPRYGGKRHLPAVPDEWEVIETSSIEVFASGMVEFDYDDEKRIRIPFVTCVIFSCTRHDKESCDLCWAASFN